MPLPPSSAAWPSSDAGAALAALRAGTLTPEALLADCLTRIERDNGRINALVTLDIDAARRAACACRQFMDEQGIPAGQPLFGLPVSVKDAWATAGLRTTASHPPLADYVPAEDAAVVARLKAAGAVLVGKSNLSQLAGDPQCWSPLFGPTRNPWDDALTPGGSSGGAAAAIAMGFSWLEVGSDIGGSIRIPAAYCGVVGLKATENRIPRSGHIPHLPGGLRSVRHLLSFGLLARSVGDLALGLPVLAGAHPDDPEVPPLPVVPLSPPQRPLRIAWWDDFAGLPLCPRTRAGLDQALARLRAAGHRVERAWPGGMDIRTCWQVYGCLAGAEIGLGMASGQRRLLAVASHLIPGSWPLSRAFAAGAGASWRRYSAALARRDALIAALDGFLGDYDLLLCPVAASTAYPAFPLSSRRLPPHLQVAGVRLPYIEASVGHSVPFSLTGNPVLSLPAGLFDGLPVGLQAVGRRWQDEALLAACAVVEAVLGPRPLPPGA